MSTSNDDVKFIPGLRLSGLFYEEAVRPILAEAFPSLRYAAALIGSGSEVLGLDDIMSSDHHWGPRLMLFLSDGDHELLADSVRSTLAERLPASVRGYSTHWGPPDPEDGSQFLEVASSGPINHRVALYTAAGFFAEYLAFDINQPLEPADWLTFSEQRLRTVTAGAVFHDDLGLEQTRARFSYYPRDVWLYLLAAGWARIGQEEHLMGRAGWAGDELGSGGDELGSALIGARLARDIMRLCFLMERVYTPYPKWFGTAFRALASAAEISPALTAALSASSWQERESYLVRGYEYIARQHNSLGLTKPFAENVTSFHGRPFRVMAFRGFSDALLAEIRDPSVKRIAEKQLIGSIDLFSDSADLLSYPEWRPILRQLYAS